MKIINWYSYDDKEIIDTISVFWIKGFSFKDIKEVTEEKGYYLPEDQWIAYGKVLNIQLDLQIGRRKNEFNNK